MSRQPKQEKTKGSNQYNSEKYAKIGKTLDIEGEISGQENLSIEGQFSGIINLELSDVLIEANSIVKAEIHARNVQIKGQVEGNVFAAEKVHIEKNGQMNGDIIATRISIDDGAVYKGLVKIDTTPSSSR